MGNAYHFGVYLYSRKFNLITDHCPLTWLKSLKEPKGRLACWILALEDYSYNIEYRCGIRHQNGDALSRRPYYYDDGLIDSKRWH